MNSSIDVQHLKKSYGKYSILEDVSLQIDTETIYGLVGLNGAGKTTFLRLLLGILKPDDGTISIMNMAPWDHKEEFYRNTGVVLDHDGFWGSLSVMENLLIYASAKGLSKEYTKKYFEEFWGKTALYTSDKKVKHLSRGQKMQCAICRAFLGWPKVYFLDEPALALDMTAYEHLCTLIKEARTRGSIVIISSHQLDTIDVLCNRVGILRDKKLSELLKCDTQKAWTIKADSSEHWGDIIKQCGAKNVSYDMGWHFAIDNAEHDIPHIVKMLVSAGCSIFEVKKEQRDTGFGTTIRNLYSIKNSGGE